MLTHSNLWLALDQLAQMHGLSPSGLAKKAGLNITSFNPSKRISSDGRKRWPSTESIARVLNATETSCTDFALLLDGSHTPRFKRKIKKMVK